MDENTVAHENSAGTRPKAKMNWFSEEPRVSS
jgi:hypothetical protein